MFVYYRSAEKKQQLFLSLLTQEWRLLYHLPNGSGANSPWLGCEISLMMLLTLCKYFFQWMLSICWYWWQSSFHTILWHSMLSMEHQKNFTKVCGDICTVLSVLSKYSCLLTWIWVSWWTRRGQDVDPQELEVLPQTLGYRMGCVSRPLPFCSPLLVIWFCWHSGPGGSLHQLTRQSTCSL